MKLLSILFFTTLLQYPNDYPFDIISYLQSLLGSVGSSVVNGIESLFYKIFGLFAEGVARNTGEIMQSVLTLNLNPMEPLMVNAYSFINNITFAIAQLSFAISLGIFVLPLPGHETLSAGARNNIYSSLSAVILISMAPVIIQFFTMFSSQLSQSVLISLSGQDISGIVANILLSLVTLDGFFFLFLDAIALLLVATMVVVAVILGALAPILFLMAITVFSLGFAKNISNKLFTQSIFLWILPAIGLSIIAVDIVILGSIVSPLTPLVIFVLDYLILRISFSIASDVGATYPVIDIMNRATSSAIMLGTIYLTKGKMIPLTSVHRKFSNKEQEVK